MSIEANTRLLNGVTVSFRGGHGKYQFEFLGSAQKAVFMEIITPFLTRNVSGSLLVRVAYTLPAAKK